MLFTGNKKSKGLNTSIGNYKLICLPSDQVHYGNGFVVSNKISIHRYWKVSDRIAILQVKQNEPLSKKPTENTPNYKSSLQGTRLTIKQIPPKHIATIINVYAPTSIRATQNPKELEEMYRV